jgi:DNA-binding transcriptional LysR family regulator
MDVLNAMKIFRAVAERGGFSAAAASLGLSKASVSKQVAALEDRLGARLFNRTTRKLSLTEVGQGYLDRASRILDDVAETEALVTRHHASPCGTLRINAPMSFGLMHLSPALCDFMARYPDLTVDLGLNDRRIDLIEEGVDAAVRIGVLDDSSLIARKLAPCRFAVCAAPDYWQTHGKPERPEDLGAHDCFVYTYGPHPFEWRFDGPDGRTAVRVEGTLRANNGQILLDAVRGGHGIGLFPTFMAGADLRAGTLERGLDRYTVPEQGIFIVYPPGRHLSAKVRAFVDFLADRFGGEPSWDHPAG